MTQVQHKTKKSVPTVAVIGTGPAGLMAASVLQRHGIDVLIFEKKRGPGKKLLIAGKSGLNITHDLPIKSFAEIYTGPKKHFQQILKDFSPEDWLQFIHKLGLKTFRGTSHRYFLEGLKTAPLLKAWLSQLKSNGAKIFYQYECTSFAKEDGKIALEFNGNKKYHADAVCLALGGASYEPDETPLRWPALFKKSRINFTPFSPSNVGFGVDWSQELLAEAEGLPLKNIQLTTTKGSLEGELTITKYGLEGTPIYTLGETGKATLDLKPALSEKEIFARISSSKKKMSPYRQTQKNLALCPASLALLFHMTPPNIKNDAAKLSTQIKKFPLMLTGPQGLDFAISSAGGIGWDELDNQLMLKKFPGIFVAGEMIDWDAPTGGFLIQACVSQGHWAGEKIAEQIVGVAPPWLPA